MIDLRLLGQVSLRSGAIALDMPLRQRKRFALLAHLTLGSRDGFLERDAVIATFWPHLDEAHGRLALRKALHFLRQQIGPGILARQGRHRIGVASGALRCDALEFLSAIDAGHLEYALECYRGELMPAYHLPMTPGFERWIEDERGRFWRLAYDGAIGLARRHHAEGALERAADYVRSAERVWPTSEEAAEMRVQLLHELGRNGAALEAYRDFASRLASELEMTPGRRMQELVASVRRSS